MDHRVSFYKKVVFMYLNNKSFGRALISYGLKKIYIYGAGDIADMVLSDLLQEGVKFSLFDKYKGGKKIFKNVKKKNFEIDIKNVCDIPKDNVPILITPINNISEIIKELTAFGIKKNRLVSVHFLADICLNNIGVGQLDELFHCHKFLITGGGEVNKGAHSMVLTTIDGIRKKYNDAIFFVTMHTDDNKDLVISDKYNYIILSDMVEAQGRIYEIIPFIDGVFDVSGYALSSARNLNGVTRSISYFRLAYDYSIPLYIMPQSVGVMNLSKTEKNELKELLSYANRLFIREREGAEIIKKEIGISVMESYDMVLLSDEPSLERIMRKGVCPKEISINTSRNVAIIPNVQNLNFINEEDLIEIYQHVIDRVCGQNRNVYIFNHANDESLCKKIYRKYEKSQNVFVVLEDLDPVSFCNCIGKFDYAIASRYHSVVHAFRHSVPCLVVGWDQKYHDLLKIFDQDTYMYDIRDDIDIDTLDSELDYLDQKFSDEGKKIKKAIGKIKRPDFFSFVEEVSAYE